MGANYISGVNQASKLISYDDTITPPPPVMSLKWPTFYL